MAEMVFVSRSTSGKISGVFALLQPGLAQEQLASDNAEVVAYLNPPVIQTVLPQDLVAQFTVADYGLIKVANTADDAKALLWAALQAQADPMLITNARFKQGWSYLVGVLGQPRMNVIAGPPPGLNIPSLVV